MADESVLVFIDPDGCAVFVLDDEPQPPVPAVTQPMDQFICGSCQTSFSQLPDFLRHKTLGCSKVVEEQQQQQQPPRVDPPATVAPSPMSARRRLSPSGQSARVCQFCGKVFSKKFDLENHVRYHTGEKKYACPLCTKGFTQKSNMTKHLKSHKTWPSSVAQQVAFSSASIETKMWTTDGHDTNLTVDQMYKCFICSQVAADFNSLRSHLKIHSDLKAFQCPLAECEATFDSVDDYTAHLVEAGHVAPEAGVLMASGLPPHSGTTASQPVPPPGDPDEGDGAMQPPADRDCLSAAPVPPLGCGHCGLSLSSKKERVKHLKMAHGLSCPCFQCSICGQTLSSSSNLQTHLLIHTGQLPFQCDTCQACFNRSDKLARHQLIHQKGATTFRCPFKATVGCSKTFYRFDKLKDHVASHANVKPELKCKICSLSFMRAKELRSHLKSEHNGGGRLQCLFCSQTFCWEKRRKEHHLTVHGEDPLDSSSIITPLSHDMPATTEAVGSHQPL